jgi:hypothetical protein
MNLLLDLLTPHDCPAVQKNALLVLVTAMIGQPAVTRTFEQAEGLLTVCTLFHDGDTTQQVKLKLVEFLYFYLMPETPTFSDTGSANAGFGAPGNLQRSPSKLLSAFERKTKKAEGTGRALDLERRSRGSVRSQNEKQKLLGRYLNNVDELVNDLQESLPFGQETPT